MLLNVPFSVQKHLTRSDHSVAFAPGQEFERPTQRNFRLARNSRGDNYRGYLSSQDGRWHTKNNKMTLMESNANFYFQNVD